MEGRIILYFFLSTKKKKRCVRIYNNPCLFSFCFALSWRRVLLAGEGAVQETERCYVNE